MERPVASVVTCSVCGEPLNPKGQCPACLLRTALDESVGKSAPPALLIFGDFEIVRRDDGSLWELGRGAFGVTYLAVDNVLRRRVALKVIDVPAAARTSQTMRERFLREARAAAALRHPNVAGVYQFGASPDDSHCYYAMELVEGETLEARVRRDGPLNAKLVLEIAIQITRTLMAAAAHGLVHRDLKPGNIMLTRGDNDKSELEVKVIDFGLAKAIADAGGEMDLTRGGFVGTPNFASPEQFESGLVDVRSDIYSLGATLWFALTGKTPFPGRDIEEIRSAQKSNALPVEQLKAARVPHGLRSVLESMLAFEPAARPGIQDLATQLRRCSALAEIEMPADGKKEIQLEIAHVLFIDIVGYSKLSIDEQHAAIGELTQIVLTTEQFQKAEAADRLIKIPSGDGMALVFYTSPEAPVRCAVEISRALKEHPRVQVRMGIHSGPVRGVVDVTGRSNLAGAGLNLAQRVMKCGDAGHILLSKHVAEDLSEFDEWRPLLHDLGTCEVKHGVPVAVVNLWSDDAGNRRLPQQFESLRKRRARVRWAEVAAALLLLAAIVAAFLLVSKKTAPSTSNAPEKSIAVLPFENLSRDADNAFLAEGIQDEILTRLSKIADLKVISRTSTQHYKSAPENLSQIAKQLGVANILEGSVQKSGDAVRVNVQLIKADTDSHLWADSFDRKLIDIFSVESEVAKAVADQLRAKLTGQEQQIIAAKPTDNVEAYDAYQRGLAYTLKTTYTSANAVAAQKYLQQAVRLDPKFALAWALLSYVDSVGYITQGLQPTLSLREEARQAAETALALQPGLGEAVLADGFYHYACLKEYDTAERVFEQARQLLPNSSQIPAFLAYISRRRGEWDRSESYFREAERLDPRNANLLTQHFLLYFNRRLFPEALRQLDLILDITPDDLETVARKAAVAQAEGDLPRAAALLAPLHPNADDPNALETQIYQTILERRPEKIISILEKILEKPDPALGYTIGELRFYLGWAQEVAGDTAAARGSWRQARSELEALVKEQPGNSSLVGTLALTNMGLDDKAAALALAARAMEINPIEKDALNGPWSLEIFARVAANTGEPDRAIAALEKLLSIPYNGPIARQLPLTPALLRLDPMFDPLRGDPRFQKLVKEENKLVAPGISGEPNIAPAPEKSVAVLPFENLSRDPDNAFFADGVQDEILTDLARIADLTVISRTSVMQYKSGIARNVREIGQQLGVAHLVEGSVQRAGNRVRVNAQLIDARTDQHLWGQTYDRDLADVFAIQSEIAKTIADQLQAKLSPREKSAIDLPPTNDLMAFDLYTRAKDFILTARIGSADKTDFLAGIELLNQAVARDPSFFDAYCQLAAAHDWLYLFGLDHTPARLALAEAALDAAARLRPDAGETHLARAQNLYAGHRDYTGALAELELARQTLPNDSRIYQLMGFIQRRQKGRYEESTRTLEHAIDLDPRNPLTLNQIAAFNYPRLGRYADAKLAWDRSLAIRPDDTNAKVGRAWVDFDWKADTRPLHQTIDSIRATNADALQTIADAWLFCALAERDAAAAKDALAAAGEKPILYNGNVFFNRVFAEGVIARMTHDDAAARSAFTAARAEQEKIVQAQPSYGPALCVLGLIDAGLGRKEEAIREGRRAVELLPVEKDAHEGMEMIEYLAMIAAWVGDKDLACEQLGLALSGPSGLTYGELKLLPLWDPLRGDPRFEKIVASLAPKD